MVVLLRIERKMYQRACILISFVRCGSAFKIYVTRSFKSFPEFRQQINKASSTHVIGLK
jgi:hypothetical protein